MRRCTGRKSWDAPGKERGEGEGRVKGRVRIRTHSGVDLTAATETVEGIEEPGAHEADEPEEDDLAGRVVVETLEAGRSLVEHRAAARGRVLAGVVGQGHGYGDAWVGEMGEGEGRMGDD